MKKIYKYSFLLMVCAFTVVTNALEKPSDNIELSENNDAQNIKINDEINNIKDDLKKLRGELNENYGDLTKVRNEQINYKIEKDLLKEGYSTSLGTITTVASVLFGFSTIIGAILGYFGFKSIKEIKKEYQLELDNLRKIKAQLDIEVNSFKLKISDFNKRVEEITSTNKSQNERLETLELIEKIGNLVRNGHYAWALKHIEIGLSVNPYNTDLLRFKATCLGRLGKFEEYITTNKAFIEHTDDPSEKLAGKTNLLEMYAITNQKKEFNEIYSECYQEITSKFGKNTNHYLTVLMDIFSGNLLNAKKTLDALIKVYLTKPADKIIGDWRFDEVREAMLRLKKSKKRDYLEKTIDFFSGKISAAELEKELESS